MSTCITYSPISYQRSDWVAAWLPVRYTLSSTKWPVNTFDDTDDITAIVNNGGFARITLSSTSITYVAKETIQITLADVTAYNGIWTVKTVHSSTDITISAPYTSTATGKFQRYYNNYTIKVRVFVGIPISHDLYSTRPMTQKGEMTLRPDTSNQAVVDISSYVRADISPIENKLCDIISDDIYGNDTNLWTGFYISYAESYDLSNGTDVSTFTSGYVADLSEDGYSDRYFYASNSTHQFQYVNGKSMGEYAINDVVIEDFVAKFMTDFDRPTYFLGNEHDLAVIISYQDWEISGFSIQYVLTEYDTFGATLATTTYTMTTQDPGVYRFAFSEFTFDASTTEFTFMLKKSTGEALTETKTINLDRSTCGKNPVYLRWLNPIGGFDSWLFTADHDSSINVFERDVTRRDVTANWDTQFSLTGDTEDDYVRTQAHDRRLVRSQYFDTANEKASMRWLKASTKVYHVFLSNDTNCGNYRQRTVLVDSGEFTYQADGEKLKRMELGFRYTDPVRIQGQ